MVDKSVDMTLQAREFLQSGKVSTLDLGALESACDKLVRAETQKSLPEAIKLAKSFVKFSLFNKSMSLLAAYRALGWTLLSAGKYDKARDAYLEARKVCHNDSNVRARIDRILIDVYMYLGEFDEAKRCGKLALATFKRSGDEHEFYKTRINYGNVYHRQDQHKAAGRIYTEAVEYFSESDDQMTLGLAKYNLANVQVQMCEFESAATLYLSAEELFSNNNAPLYALECRYGRAWLNLHIGNYHPALLLLADCQKEYAQAGHKKGVMLCMLDRAEVYLGLNLFGEAKSSAKNAESEASKLGLRYESSKAAYFVAKACAELSENKCATEALKRANAGFSKEKNNSYLLATTLLSAQMSPDSATRKKLINEASAGFSGVQSPVWSAICDLQLIALGADDERVFKRLARNKAVKSVPYLFAQWQTLQGVICEEQGKSHSAVDYWSKAAIALDALRAKLPLVEMRSSFMQNQNDPFHHLVRAKLKNEPDSAAVWAERSKTVGIWSGEVSASDDHPAKIRAQQSLISLARTVSALTERIDSPGQRHSNLAPGAQKRIDSQQRTVQRALAALGNSKKSDSTNSDSKNYEAFDHHQMIQKMKRESQLRPIVNYLIDNGDILAFVINKGDFKVHVIEHGLRRLQQAMGCWRILVGSKLEPGTKSSKVDLAQERSLFDGIAEWLWNPLGLEGESDQALIIPDGQLSNVPWLALRANKRPLLEDWSISLSPSFRHFLKASTVNPKSQKVKCFVGDYKGLVYPQSEVDHFSKLPEGTVEIHSPSKREDWLNNDPAWIWHYTGHAQFRSDNPFYSALLLEDGPLFAADFKLMNTPVSLVTLAACRTSQQSSVPGYEATGIVRSLLEMGAANVVGSPWAVKDETVACWMDYFYKEVFAGNSISSSVRGAALKVREKYPSAYEWAGFSVFGTGK